MAESLFWLGFIGTMFGSGYATGYMIAKDKYSKPGSKPPPGGGKAGENVITVNFTRRQRVRKAG